MLQRFRSLIYVASFAVLSLGALALLVVPAIDKGFTQPFTGLLVVICSGIMNAFGAKVVASGVVLSFSGAPGAVMVSSGCNAVEVCILFASAIAPFPAPLAGRVIGIIAGIMAIQALNILRIISLLILARYAQDLFDFFHLFVWDALIILDGIVLFLAWNHWQIKRWPGTSSAQLQADISL